MHLIILSIDGFAFVEVGHDQLSLFFFLRLFLVLFLGGHLGLFHF